jgi:N-glycosylase/DNA lyase
VTSGQLFRWVRGPVGVWLGVDGANWFRVTAAGPGACDVESNAASADFERLFRLEPEWDKVEDDLVVLGPELRPLIEALPGLRLCRPSDPVETLFSFLCSSNNHVPRIKTMVEHLTSFGPILAEVDGRPLRRFPAPEALADVSEEELRRRGFGYRGATIPRAARRIVDRGGAAYLRALAESPSELARAALLELPGVGPKLADCILLFALGRTETVPIDTHIWQALTRRYFPEWQGTTLTELKYRAAASYMRERFGPLAGWAQQYLFFDNMLNWRTFRAEKD